MTVDLLPWLPWLAALVVLGLWMLGAHNRVTALRAAVLAAWAAVDSAFALRGQALATLLASVAQPLADEAAAVDAVAAAQGQLLAAQEAVRRRPLARDSVTDLSKADAVLAAVLVRLLALVDQQPALRSDAAVRLALGRLKDAPAQLAFARQVYNQAGSAYNLATQQFPTRLLGSMLGFAEVGRL